MVVSGLLLFYFYRATSQYTTLRVPEGQQPLEYPKHSWLIFLVSFTLTVIYLPISTMAMHILVWSDDLWVVPNPYTNSTSNPPTVAPLGPSDEYRTPLDFCWTTTMRLDEVNFAPVLIILATACIAGVSADVILRLCHVWLTVTLVAHSLVPRSFISHYQKGRPGRRPLH